MTSAAVKWLLRQSGFIQPAANLLFKIYAQPRMTLTTFLEILKQAKPTTCGQGCFFSLITVAVDKSEGAADLILQTFGVVSIYYASDQSGVSQDFFPTKHEDLALFTN